MFPDSYFPGSYFGYFPDGTGTPAPVETPTIGLLGTGGLGQAASDAARRNSASVRRRPPIRPWLLIPIAAGAVSFSQGRLLFEVPFAAGRSEIKPAPRAALLLWELPLRSRKANNQGLTTSKVSWSYDPEYWRPKWERANRERRDLEDLAVLEIL